MISLDYPKQTEQMSSTTRSIASYSSTSLPQSAQIRTVVPARKQRPSIDRDARKLVEEVVYVREKRVEQAGTPARRRARAQGVPSPFVLARCFSGRTWRGTFLQWLAMSSSINETYCRTKVSSLLSPSPFVTCSPVDGIFSFAELQMMMIERTLIQTLNTIRLTQNEP